MAYQLVLKRVNEEEKRHVIATHIAEMSGAQMQQIVNAISTKSISLGRDFSFEKASEMKASFEAMGAEIIMKDLASPVVETPHYDDEEEDEEEGVLLTHAEYTKALNKRSDIFTVEKDKKLTFIMPFAFILSMAFGFSLWSMNIMRIDPHFIPDRGRTTKIKLSTDVAKVEVKKKDEPEKEKIEKEKVDLKKPKRTTRRQRRQSSGGGSASARTIKKAGVLGKLTDPITSQRIQDADPFAKGGYAKGLDALMSGGKGIKVGSSGSTGKRNGAAGIGFNNGNGSGFDGGARGIGGFDKLAGADTRNIAKVDPRTPRTRIKPPLAKRHGGIAGGRSRAEIMRTVRNNMSSLKYAYNKHLKKNPGMGGKIKLKWAIDEFGNVLHCRVISSNINDKEFEEMVVRKVRSWAFGKIKIPGDVTEVTYPFVFTR